jgi:hypothetical protein
MLHWIIQNLVVSLILIIMVHYLYIFFKDNLTIPKVKDLVNKPQQQYEDILSNINNNINSDINSNINSDINSNTSNNVTKESSNIETNIKMKDELKNYLKELSISKRTSVDNNNNSNNSNSNNSKHIPINVNDNNGILTGENAMISSFSSNNYTSF